MLALVVALSAVAFDVEAPPYSQTWIEAPARYEVESDVRTARVSHVAGDLVTEIPSKVQQHREKRYVFWMRADDGTQPATYRIEPNEVSSYAPPVFVGAGDMLDYGAKNVTADLGVGLWGVAIPLDWDDDGDWDLLYSCADVPQSGMYVYLQNKFGVFEQTARLGDGEKYPALADMNGDGKADLLCATHWYDDVRTNGLGKKIDGPLVKPEGNIRAFMARQVDWDGDGALDLLSAVGHWDEYGWDRGYDETGDWIRGPLHGYVYFHKNIGTNRSPIYAEKKQLEADDHPIDVYGWPSPCAADWDGDGDLDLICGEFRDEFTYFENVGTRENPRLAAPQAVMTMRGRLRVDLCMMTPFACDWNNDGKPDLVVGQEDGRVSIILHRGMNREAPVFAEERFLREANPPVKSGALVTPWIEPQTGDLFCGNTAGYFEVFSWRDNRFSTGRYLQVDGKPLRIQAGYNGSVQGPAEEKWGYTVPTLGDIDADGTAELVYNSILGRIEYVEAAGQGVTPPIPVKVAWEGPAPYPAWNWWKPEPEHLVVQWRTRPLVLDWDGDNIQDLVAVDHEGYLAFYRSNGRKLEPGQRVFKGEDGNPIRLNEKEGGGSGRAKIDMVDWDGDGDLDLLRNTTNTGWFEQTADKRFVWRGDLPGRKLAGHTTCPHAVDWNSDGRMDLIVGAEDGRIYCYNRAALDEPDKIDTVRK